MGKSEDKRGKKASALKVIGGILIIFLILILLIAGVGIYLYKYHVFKTLRICISEDSQDMIIPCTSNDFCFEQVIQFIPELQKNLEKMPDFARDKMEEVFESAIFCDQTCKIKQIRGLGEDIGSIDFCEEDEQEIKLEIRGKEAIEFLRYMRMESS